MKPQERNAAIMGSKLEPRSRFILIAVASFMSDDNLSAWPAPETLAELTGYSLSSVKAVLAELVAAGVITRSDEGRRAKVTRIVWAVLAAVEARPALRGGKRAPSEHRTAPSEHRTAPSEHRTAPSEHRPANRPNTGPDPTIDPTSLKTHTTGPLPGPVCVPPVDDAVQAPAELPAVPAPAEPDPPRINPAPNDPPRIDEPAPKSRVPQPPTVPWAPPARECAPLTRAEFVELCGLVYTEVTHRLWNPSRGKDTGTAVLRHWRALGKPPVEAYLAEVALVARACRECGQHMFRNDVRGLRLDGTPWRGDDSRNPGMVLRMSPSAGSSGASWDARLTAAEAWAAEGFPPDTAQETSPRAARAKRGVFVPTATPHPMDEADLDTLFAAG